MAARRFFSSQGGNSGGHIFGIRWFHIPVSVGVGVLAFVHIRRKLKRQQNDQVAKVGPTHLQVNMVKHLPSRALSRVFGHVSRSELPSWMLTPLLRVYVKTFGCDMKEAEVEDLKHYRTLGQLFLRKLKSGTRPINTEHSLTSPCDGTVLHFGDVQASGHLEQIKGVHFSLEGFLGEDVASRMTAGKEESDKKRLCFITVYLSPGDCHHFHSPANWRATLRRHVPGQLLPVSPWAVKLLPGLFTVNERVVLAGDWKYGTFTYSAIGAFNVGSISIADDKDLHTNAKKESLYLRGFRDRDLLRSNAEGMVMKKGDYVGTFNLGSTIVLVFEAPGDFSFTVQPKQKIKLGQCIGSVADSKPNMNQ